MGRLLELAEKLEQLDARGHHLVDTSCDPLKTEMEREAAQQQLERENQEFQKTRQELEYYLKVFSWIY